LTATSNFPNKNALFKKIQDVGIPHFFRVRDHPGQWTMQNRNV